MKPGDRVRNPRGRVGTIHSIVFDRSPGFELDFAWVRWDDGKHPTMTRTPLRRLTPEKKET